MNVLEHKAKIKIFFTTGKQEEIGTETKIAHFQGVTLYETQILHYEAPVQHINFDTIADADTIVSNEDSVFSKKTYLYYLIKNGEKTGKRYDTLDSAGEKFYLDTFLNQSNMGPEHEVFLSKDFGRLTKLIKTGHKTIEKFSSLEGESKLDTLFLYYDDWLKTVDFSISPYRDAKSKSKLQKFLYVHKIEPGFQKVEAYKYEMTSEFDVITPSCTERQLEVFRLFIEKYLAEIQDE
jgi:hypothetical protein